MRNELSNSKKKTNFTILACISVNNNAYSVMMFDQEKAKNVRITFENILCLTYIHEKEKRENHTTIEIC